MKAALLWLALLALGQVALFDFTNAGNTLHYQHLAFIRWKAHLPALAMLASQAIAVAASLAGRGLPIPRPRLLLLAAIIVSPSAAPSRDLRFYATELATAGAIVCV